MIKKRIIKILVFAFIMSLLSHIAVLAKNEDELNYNTAHSYNYDVNKKSFATPAYYFLTNERIGDFTNATDICVKDSKIYALNTGSIDIYDAETLDLLGSITSVHVNFSDAKGFFITDSKKIYITQYQAQSIVVIDFEGNKLNSFGKPTSSLITENFTYKPTKITVQDNGLIYVVSDGTYDGLIQLDKNGDFVSFFGANKVTMTATLLLQQVWNQFFTSEQKNRSISAIPTSYDSVSLSSNNLIYACSSSSDLTSNQVKKLSPYGNDITNTSYSDVFGDFENAKVNGTTTYNAFTDISVDERNIISVLDSNNGKIFQYDSESHLLGVFGGISNQKGTFSKPVAIDTYQDDIFVLDKGNSRIYKLCPTEYGNLIRTGVSFYLSGRVLEAESYYNKIYTITSNLSWVSSGLGQAALAKNDYVLGMKYFKAAKDTNGYNECLEAYRTQIIGKYFWIIFLLILVVFLLIWILAGRATKKENTALVLKGNKKLNPFSLLSHPASFSIIKEEKRGSLLYATGVIVLTLVTRVVTLGMQGFVFNPTEGINNNYPLEMLQVLLLFICFVACSWAVGTFLDGEGKIKDLFISFSYALLPYCICNISGAILSNVLTLRETAFVTGLQTLGLFWTALLIVIATVQINSYSMPKTVISLVSTVLAMIFVLFIIIMMATLIGKIVSFFSQLIEEIAFNM